ncbi:MAG: hypothetical protein LH649_07860 [Pseudanabaena sp. CAN_BIN31]|nr:hypothetical protein [Pseudanabaena sp. CAN_BIN31]
MFQSLIGISDRHKRLSNAEFAEMSQQLFTSADYDSPDKTIQMLHEVKQEIATEREQQLKKSVNG